MAMRYAYEQEIWDLGLTKEEIEKISEPMDVWRDTDGNEIDFEAEFNKGHTGFLYQIEFFNEQLYMGRKLVILSGHRRSEIYYGSGTKVQEYVDKYGTHGIKRTALKFLSGNIEELREAEYEMLVENNVVVDDRYLNLIDDVTPLVGKATEINGKIVAIDKNNNKRIFESQQHACEEISKIAKDMKMRKRHQNITIRMIKLWIFGKTVGHEKYLKDIYLMNITDEEKEILDQERNKKRAQKKEQVEKQTKHLKELYKDPAMIEQASIASKKRFEDPEMLEQARKRFKDPKQRNKISNALKKEGKIYFADERGIQTFKGWNEMPEIDGISTRTIQAQFHGDYNEFIKYGILKIEFNEKTVESFSEEEIAIRQETLENIRLENTKKAKKEGKIYFDDERDTQTFKGKIEGAEIANVTLVTFANWLRGISNSFVDLGIVCIEFGNRIIKKNDIKIINIDENEENVLKGKEGKIYFDDERGVQTFKSRIMGAEITGTSPKTFQNWLYGISISFREKGIYKIEFGDITVE